MDQRLDFREINKAYSSVVNDMRYKTTYNKHDPNIPQRYYQLSSSYVKIDKEWLQSYINQSQVRSQNEQSASKHNDNPAFLTVSSLRSQLKLSQTTEGPSVDETLQMLESRDLA